jgi:hypothetical protein
MNTQAKNVSFKESLESFEEKVKGRLHVYVKETRNGLPAISCLWNETPSRTIKDVVFVGEDESFDALAAVRAVNKSSKASDHVVTMLIEMFGNQHPTTPLDAIEF